MLLPLVFALGLLQGGKGFVGKDPTPESHGQGLVQANQILDDLAIRRIDQIMIVKVEGTQSEKLKTECFPQTIYRLRVSRVDQLGMLSGKNALMSACDVRRTWRKWC